MVDGLFIMLKKITPLYAYNIIKLSGLVMTKLFVN